MKKLLSILFLAFVAFNCDQKPVAVTEEQPISYQAVLNTAGTGRLVLYNGDTLILTTTKKTQTWYQTDTVIRKKAEKPIDTVVVVPPPVNPASYLSLPMSGIKSYEGINGLVLENLQFTNLDRGMNDGNIIQLRNCSNIIIRNCYFGKSFGEAISIEGGSNITIEKNLFANNRTGVYAVKTTGNLKVVNNEFINPLGPMPRGQYVQLNTCSGSGNLIQGNRGEAFMGESNPEDLISLFASTGTATSPITVKDNVFRGGGPSASGGGIMAGDYNGNYVLVDNNILVDPGQYGVAASGGNNVVITNNKVFGKRQSFTNIGFYVANYSGTPCSNITVKGNSSNYTNATGTINNFWSSGECGPVQWDGQNTTGQSLASMNVPSHLFKFITAAELLKIRGK